MLSGMYRLLFQREYLLKACSPLFCHKLWESKFQRLLLRIWKIKDESFSFTFGTFRWPFRNLKVTFLNATGFFNLFFWNFPGTFLYLNGYLPEFRCFFQELKLKTSAINYYCVLCSDIVIVIHVVTVVSQFCFIFSLSAGIEAHY